MTLQLKREILKFLLYAFNQNSKLDKPMQGAPPNMWFLLAAVEMVSFTCHPWAGGSAWGPWSSPGVSIRPGAPLPCVRTSSLLQSGNQRSPSQREFIFHKAEVQNINDHL